MTNNLKLEKRVINGVVYIISPVKRCNFSALIFEPNELHLFWKVEICALIIIECNSFEECVDAIEQYFKDYVNVI